MARPTFDAFAGESFYAGGPMERLPTRLDGLVLLAPAVHGDARGFFMETWRADAWQLHGVPAGFVQDNHSRSRRGTLRGHPLPDAAGSGQARARRPRARAGRGGRPAPRLADVRRVGGGELDDEHGAQLWIPVGFGHGFCVLSDIADFVYKCTSYYDPATEAGIRFDDPDVGIEWPQDVELLYSERDRLAPTLAQVADELPFRYAE